MNAEETKAAQEVIDTPATTENVNQPIKAFFPVKKTFQHTYICPSVACLKAANPHPGSWHQRAVNLVTDVPRTDVKCPGCTGAMVIGRNGDASTYETDSAGNLKSMGGDPLIFEKTAAEAPDQSGDESIFLKDGK